MPPERSQGRSRPRQDPVSCELCRSKKLKCDRQFPCANCRSRKVDCEYRGERPVPQQHSAIEDQLRAENRAIRARLQRLEESVFGSPHPRSSSFPIQSTPSATSASSQQPPPEQAAVDTDLNYFEDIGFRSTNALSQFSDRIEVNVLSIEETVDIFDGPPIPSSVNFMPEELAMHIINLYEEYLEPLQHIMHLTSVRAKVRDLYTALANNQDVSFGTLAIMLAIAASVSFYYPFYDPEQSEWHYVFESPQMSEKLFTVWIKQALNVVGYARSSAHISLEAVQASMLLTFLFYHVEGFSARTRLLHGGAIMMARDLGLQRTDVPVPEGTTKGYTDPMDAEVARKVWWQLTATDWFLAFAGGSHGGTYSIHPRQMMVNKPYNLHPTDIQNADPRYARDPSRPTVMSYFLQRVKLAEICREAVDVLSETYYACDPLEIAYENVVAIDGKFAALFDEMPLFMKLETSPEVLRAQYGTAYHAAIVQQRAMAHLMAHTRRCKLHVPFLLRVKADSRFAFSRQKCLQSARTVFEIRRISWDEKTTRKRTRIGGVLHHFYYAAMVLVLDLCVNDRDDEASLADVWEALKLLEDARGNAPVADEFIRSLKEVLRKNQLELPVRQRGNQVESVSPQSSSTHMQNPQAFTGFHPPVLDANVDPTYSDQRLPPLTEDMWQGFVDYGQQLDMQSWDAILNDLEMRML